jgi:hypothetical protein
MTDRNSLVAHTKAYYHNMFKDIEWLYGTRLRELERDRTHLLSVLDGHGMRIPCIDLPAVAKHFDRCLDEGKFIPSRLPLTRFKSRKVRLPIFLGQLYQLVFHNDGTLRNDASIDAIVAIRQCYLGLKKLELPCSDRSIQDEIQNFLEIETRLRPATSDWYQLGQWGHHSFYDASHQPRDGRGRFCTKPSKALQERLRLLHNVCDIVSVLFGDTHSELPGELPKHGPGVVSNLRRGEDKYSFPSWNERLEAVFPYDMYAVANNGLLHDDRRNLSRAENSSRLICVPKTLKAPRLIAAEPVENQWTQQLVKSQLETRLRFTPISASIDFRSQERNQEAALLGSTNGSNVTVDLSSASDRLSCWVVERVFRRNPGLLDRLAAVRTAEVGGDLLPHSVRMKKFSTMGSAVTFPTQSIVYALCAVACIHPLGTRVSIASIRRASTKVRVFGDDIVLPNSGYQLLSEMLAYFQLKVNEDKTYRGVNFRESCGVDAFRGEDVSPVYAKSLPDGKASPGQVASMVQTSNNFHAAGFWNVGALFREGSGVKNSLIPVIPTTGGSFGYTSFTGFLPPPYKRWNKRYQCDEYKVLRPIKDNVHVQRDNWTSLLQYFIEEPEPVYDWKSGYKRFGRVTLHVGWDSLLSR